MFFTRKSSDLKAVNRTIKLLLDFHGVKLENEQFKNKYAQLINLRNILFKTVNKDDYYV